MSGRQRSRVERVRRVREIEAEISLGGLRLARAASRAAEAAEQQASADLGAWDAAAGTTALAGLFSVRRNGLATQARQVARLGDETVEARMVEQERFDDWSVRARRVEGLDRLVGRIAADELRDELAAERLVIEEYVVSATRRARTTP